VDNPRACPKAFVVALAVAWQPPPDHVRGRVDRRVAIGIGAFALVAITGFLLHDRRTRAKTVEPAPSAAPSVARSAAPPTDASAQRPEEVLYQAGDAGVLPSDAPKSVQFGVILFNYRGAEDAPRDARDKAKALEKAKGALEEARKDFRDATKHGDPGSTANAGRMPRGVLEPSIEYALFTLKKGELVADPIDTPRGYWVVKRLE
jgi:hypothetical protein